MSDDFQIKKPNREQKKEADKFQVTYNPPLANLQRVEQRKLRDRRMNLTMKKASK